MRTKDLDEAIEAVSEVYCRHEIAIGARAREITLDLSVARAGAQSLVALAYGAPVTIDAGNFSDLFLIKHCERGAAIATQDRKTAEWRAGETMPLSAGLATQLEFDAAFAQKSVKIDAEKLSALCARLLGHPLDAPLTFALKPFSPEFEQVWQRTLAYVWPSVQQGLEVGLASNGAFDDYLCTLLLNHHPHNYSDEMSTPAPTPIPGLVRRAERYMTDHLSSPIGVPDVAQHLGVSVRSLQAGFRQWRNTTPNAFLMQTRLQRVRDDLLRAGADDNVTDIALKYGFSHLGRFSAQYHAAFGERPSATLRRRA
ncbi:MAG TPA: AraC family transcriptional regulator [Rhizomicrobium sp.]|nr:AraC family transcriptional regulator [Rhizomicrobium sp.]